MSRRTRLTLRWVVFGLLVAGGLAVPIALATSTTLNADVALSLLGFAIYAGLGGLIIASRDGHSTGWLLVLIGCAVHGASGFGAIPWVPRDLAAWVDSWSWTAVFSLFALLTLTFPSGHGPTGPRFIASVGRGAMWALAPLVMVAALTETLGGPEASTGSPNPFGFLPSWLNYPALLATVAIFLGGAVSLVVRRRRTQGVERAQLTWVVFALVLLVTAIVLTFAFIFGSMAGGSAEPGDEAWSVAYVLMVLFPIAFGVAILRYRLWDINVIVRRTLTYAVVIGLLAGVYVAAVLGLQALVGTESQLVVAVSTLAVAALFTPVRRRVRRWVDRRFDRASYDASLVVEGFSARLRDEVDLDGLTADLTGVVNVTLRPVSAGADWGVGKVSPVLPAKGVGSALRPATVSVVLVEGGAP